MATTVTTSYLLVRRDPSGRVLATAYGASTPAECAQRAALSGVGEWISPWQTLTWKKDVADAFWADPLYVTQGKEDADAPYGYDVLVMRQVLTVVDDPTVRSTETRYEPVIA